MDNSRTTQNGVDVATKQRVDSSKGKSRQPQSASEIHAQKAPQDVEAECCLLGSMMVKADVCDDVASLVKANDFFDSNNARLFEVLMDLHNRNRAIDHKLLISHLKQAGELETLGGVPFLARVAASVPHAAHATEYAKIIRGLALRRELISAATNILTEAHNSLEDSKELISRAENQIFQIYDGRDESSIRSFKELLYDAMDRLDAKINNTYDDHSVDTGFPDMDRLLGGLRNSEFLILAARPSMGKTAFAMNIAENVAIKQGSPVLFVSLEMSSVELIDRMLCSLAEVDGHRLRAGTVRPEDNQRLIDKAADVNNAPLYVDDSPARTVTEIAAAARRIVKKAQSLGLIVIDYLQLIEPDDPRDPRQEQVAKIARRLKGLARELDVPVLCLAQLNRQAEATKGNHRPRLSHLRESGAIEQDADVVMFVHREEYFLSGEEQERVAGEADIIVAKQRNGPTGDVKLLWQKQYTRFVSAAEARHEEIDAFNQALDSSPNF